MTQPLILKENHFTPVSADLAAHGLSRTLAR
jgi:hypothetical protein